MLLLFSLIIIISLLFIGGLRLGQAAGYGYIFPVNKKLLMKKNTPMWLILLVSIIALCLFVNADFLLASYYALFVAVGLFVVFYRSDANILMPNFRYIDVMSMAKNINDERILYSKYGGNFLRIVNVVIVSPILAVLLGAVFHAYLNIPEVDLVVYTAFFASISYAIIIVYFASTQKVFRAFLFAIAFSLTCLVLILISGKVMLK